ncbi:MAG: hypothetical protein C0490_21655 [Marivirga sp.]|nr:hypothetical protein [Marivirga sp.]
MRALTGRYSCNNCHLLIFLQRNKRQGEKHIKKIRQTVRSFEIKLCSDKNTHKLRKSMGWFINKITKRFESSRTEGKRSNLRKPGNFFVEGSG